MLPDHPQTLTTVDLAQLDRFLRSTACGRQAMGLSYAHGFLSVVASGPEQLESSEWLRLMFDEPVFESGEEGERVLGLALRLFVDIEKGLRGTLAFRPIFNYVDDSGGFRHVDAQAWCQGFVDGMGLFDELWTHATRIALQEPLGLIYQLANMPSQPDQVYARLCDRLPGAMQAIYHYW